MPKRKVMLAFTIVELLVVISILALLAALLEPVLGSAKRAALRSSCSSNLGQIGLSMNLYAGDNNDCFPAASDQYWIDRDDNWVIPDHLKPTELPNLVDVLLPYSHSPEIYRCPRDTLTQERVVHEKVEGVYPSEFSYDRTSYYFWVPFFFANPLTKYPVSPVLARDFDSRWHCEYDQPLYATPAYNLLFYDGHARFGSLADQ